MENARNPKGNRAKILLNVAVVIDMILAVAVIALAPGAVAELQFRVGHVRPAADGAAVGVGGFGRSLGGGVGASVELNDLGLLPGGAFAQQPPGVGPPGLGDHVEHVFAKEQEIVGQGDDGEQIVGEGIGEQVDEHDHQVKQGKDPGLDGNDEKQQEMGVRVQRGIA